MRIREVKRLKALLPVARFQPHFIGTPPATYPKV